MSLVLIRSIGDSSKSTNILLLLQVVMTLLYEITTSVFPVTITA